MKKYLPPIVVAIASAITHFIYFSYPAQVVFDETFATNFFGSYAKGAFFFDVHPPLAKLIVYAFGFLTGASYHTDMGVIGAALPLSIILLRLVPLVCGFLLPLVIYAISRNIGLSRMLAMTAGLLVVFENSLIVQSRFILFDIMLLLFGFIAVFLYQEYSKRIVEIKGETKRLLSSRNILLLGSAFFAAAAFSVKWTGLAFLLMIVLLELFRLYKSHITTYENIDLKQFLTKIIKTFRAIAPFLVVYACIGIILYTSIFAVHLAILPNPGPGDVFMSTQFHGENFISKFVDLNAAMYRANAYQIPSHQYQSSWWSWPIMIRPIFYWQGHDEYIYLLGNPFVYLLGIAAIIFIFGYVLLKVLLKRKTMSAAIFIVIGFLVNYAPFVFINRPMFLYHYEAALVMCILSIAWTLDRISWKKGRFGAMIAILILCISSFIYFSPLTYGLYLDQSQLQARMWLSSWR
jgi:dolichyl-phosphate-mannose-protein mannosyltransferase